MDVDGDGVISRHELTVVLKKLGMDDAAIDKTFSAMDLDSDGKIDYKEFVSWLYASPTQADAQTLSV